MDNFKDRTAIVGIGTYQFSNDSGITRWDMACRAIRSALDDAGLTPEDIDGIVQYKNEEEGIDEQAVQRALGVGNLTYWGDCPWGSGSAGGLVQRAAMAVAAGVCNYVVFFRTRKDASSPVLPKNIGREMPSGEAVVQDFYDPFGLVSEKGRVAMLVQRYIHEYNIKPAQFGWVTTVCRENGARNPNSVFHQKPITIKDYHASRMVVDPLRALDCGASVDGAMAIIIGTAERAKRLNQTPAYITAVTQSMAPGAGMSTSYYRPSITTLTEVGNVGRKLFERSGISHKDVNVAQLDDSYAPLVAMQIEELGFCKRGEGAAFCDDGARIRVGGQLPINTSGGALGEGQLYGMNHIVEAVRQIRGTSPNQVKDAKVALVATGAGGPASGVLLRRL